MKVALLLLLGAIAMCQVSQTEAFIGLGLGFPFGLGLGGFGPWGFGGFGPWGGLGFRRFGLGMAGRFGRFGRDVDEVEHHHEHHHKNEHKHEHKDVHEHEHSERTLCSYTSKNNMISCHGIKENFQCKVAPHFTALKAASYRIQNLTVVPSVHRIAKVDHQIYNLFSFDHKHEKVNEWTMIEKPESKITFGLWRNEKVHETGLRFENDKCWRQFETMMSEPEHVRFALFISHIGVKHNKRNGNQKH